MELDWNTGALAEGLRLYEAGEFFTAHESWESVLLTAPEPEKTFLQGIIQVQVQISDQTAPGPAVPITLTVGGQSSQAGLFMAVGSP